MVAYSSTPERLKCTGRSAPCICARAASRDRHGRGGEGDEWRESGASSHDAARAAYISILRRRWGCTVALAGARLRLSRAYLAGGDPDRDDHDAADAGGVAAGFDFGDAARMAAELAPVLGGAPAGQRRH